MREGAVDCHSDSFKGACGSTDVVRVDDVVATHSDVSVVLSIIVGFDFVHPLGVGDLFVVASWGIFLSDDMAGDGAFDLL